MIYVTDMEDLETLLQDAIRNGHPSTTKPWNKIFIVTEGVFSMEGSVVKLPKLIELKNRYKVNERLKILSYIFP